MELAKITSKGQITIPISIRKKLNVSAGDKILFFEENGKIVILNSDTALLQTAKNVRDNNFDNSEEM